MSEFEALEDAEETRFLPGASGQWGYGQGQMLSLPYYGLGMAGMGMGGMGMGMDAGPQAVTYDRVPVGQVEVRRGEHVHATDGPIGQVQGLVIDPSDHHVTHVLLDEGHLWGKKKSRHSDQRRARHQGRRPARPHQGPGARPATGRPRPPRMICGACAVSVGEVSGV
jgi:hypothetical protein